MARAQTPPPGQLNQRHLFDTGGASEPPQLQEGLALMRLALVLVSWTRWAPEVECCRLHRSRGCRALLGDDRQLREHLTLDLGGRVILLFTSMLILRQLGLFPLVLLQGVKKRSHTISQSRDAPRDRDN